MSQTTTLRLDPQQAGAGALGALALSALEALAMPAVIFDTDLRCVYGNPEARRQFSLYADTGGVLTWTDMDSYEGLREAAGRAMNSGQPETAVVGDPRGVRRWRVQLASMPGGAAAVFLPEVAAPAADNSTRELRQSEWRFRSLIENITEAIAILQTDGSFVYVSPVFERMLGYRIDALPRAALDLVHPDDRANSVRNLREIGARYGESRSTELRVRHRSGDWRILEATACNMLHNPAVGGILVVARDVTEQAGARQELRRYAGELEQTLARGAAGHGAALAGREDLRTPLIGIRGFAELLAGSRLDAPQHDCAVRILDAAEYLLRLIEARAESPDGQ